MLLLVLCVCVCVYVCVNNHTYTYTIGLTVGLIWASCAIAFLYGGVLVKRGDMNLGQIITVFGMMLFAVVGLGTAFSVLPEVFKSRAAWSLIADMIRMYDCIYIYILCVRERLTRV